MRQDNIRLIVSDLDGTFLRGDKLISDANRSAVAEAAKQGILFSVCTGRIAPMAEYYFHTLRLTVPVITANGAVIWDPVKKKVLWDRPMDPEEAEKILIFCRENEMDYCALTMRESYFSANNVRKSRFDQYNEIARKNRDPQMILEEFDDDFSCVRGRLIYKMLVYEVKPGQKEKAESFLRTLIHTGFTSSENGLLDIAHRQVGKGAGLLRLADILNLSPEEICAVGDYDNDIPMLQASGFGVAMANGCEAIRKAADFVTRSNEEDGVAYLIRECLLH